MATYEDEYPVVEVFQKGKKSQDKGKSKAKSGKGKSKTKPKSKSKSKSKGKGKSKTKQPATKGRQPRSNQQSSLDELLAQDNRSRRARRRLARTPEFFGDVLVGGDLFADTGVDPVVAGIPLAGGARRVKIAEHNKAYPVDRVFFHYNHFANPLAFTRAGMPDGQAVDRFTFGAEKTIGDDWSIEFRLPLVDRYSRTDADFEMNGGTFGNLALILKKLVYEDDVRAIAVGLGVDTPTGSSVTGSLPVQTIDFEVRIRGVGSW